VSVTTQNRLSGAPYQYDAAGNLLNDGNHKYTYDAENRVTTVDGGVTATYVYDAFGNRVEKTVSGLDDEYIYDNEDHSPWTATIMHTSPVSNPMP
jgi:YD repeat-containing protein